MRERTSSPKRVCGFSRASTAHSLPVPRSNSAATRVVVPMSTATAKASASVLPGSTSSSRSFGQHGRAAEVGRPQAGRQFPQERQVDLQRPDVQRPLQP